MQKETTYTGTLGEWRRQLAPLQAASSDLPHLEVPRANLEALLTRAEALTKEQSALAANRQETTRQLKEVIVEGKRLSTLLRQAVRQHFGIRSERLAEFGLQPFRGRQRKEKPFSPPEGTETKKEAEPSRLPSEPER
ncbi:MAG TPA: hypothetical protein VMW27_19790 [Thermoanaerobaculia bacterium]|nr:hypothetical protein [Thermoanaerobaculia bacterium]